MGSQPNIADLTERNNTLIIVMLTDPDMTRESNGRRHRRPRRAGRVPARTASVGDYWAPSEPAYCKEHCAHAELGEMQRKALGSALRRSTKSLRLLWKIGGLGTASGELRHPSTSIVPSKCTKCSAKSRSSPVDIFSLFPPRRRPSGHLFLHSISLRLEACSSIL